MSTPSPMQSLVDSHLNLVYSAALRQVRDPAMAEDVTQTVFIAAAAKAARLPPERMAAWLVKATRYAALNALRSQHRRRVHEHAAATDRKIAMATSFPEESIDEESLDSTLDEAMAALNETDRRVIILRYFNSRPIAEVALQLGISDNTASKRIERALERLRNHFRRRGITVSAAAIGASLGSTAIRPAPPALAGQIVRGSAKAGALATSVASPPGALLMTSGVKIGAVFLLLALGVAGGYAVISELFQPPSLPPSAPPVTRTVANVQPDVPGTTTLRGVVHDASGAPLRGVLVSQGDSNASSDYRSTRTASDGSFAIKQVALGDDMILVAQGNGLAPELIKGIVTSNPAPFSFTLQPSHTLRFRLLDVRGNPIANLPLDPFYWRECQALRIYGFKPRWTGPMSDADGLITWKNAPVDAVAFDPITPEKYLRGRFTLTASEKTQTVTIRDAIKVSISAVDAQTGAAIPSFTVVYGRGDNESAPDYWNDQHPAKGTGGNYRTSLDESFNYHFFRVEAAGYVPAVQKVKEDASQIALSFRLVKSAAGVTLNVLCPDGSSAQAAEVYVIGRDKNFSLQGSELFHDGRFAFGGGQTRLLSGADGTVAVADPHDPACRVIVIHKSGFADLTFSDAVKAPVHLAAYTRLEGMAHVGSGVASNRVVAANYNSDHEGRPYISGTFDATADESGKFVFDRLPPGHYSVGLWIETNMGSRFAEGTMASGSRLMLPPGQTVQTAIGGSGRAVTGRVVGQDKSAVPDAVYSLGRLVQKISRPQPTLPPGVLERSHAIRALPADQQAAAIAQLQNSPEMVAFEKAQSAWAAEARLYYSFIVLPDGTFRAEDIAPGDYALGIGINNAKTSQPLGNATMDFTITPLPSGRSGKPVDLGDVPMQPAKPPQ